MDHSVSRWLTISLESALSSLYFTHQEESYRQKTRNTHVLKCRLSWSFRIRKDCQETPEHPPEADWDLVQKYWCHLCHTAWTWYISGQWTLTPSSQWNPTRTNVWQSWTFWFYLWTMVPPRWRFPKLNLHTCPSTLISSYHLGTNSQWLQPFSTASSQMQRTRRQKSI